MLLRVGSVVKDGGGCVGGESQIRYRTGSKCFLGGFFSILSEFLHKKHIDIKFKKKVYIVLMFLKKLQ